MAKVIEKWLKTPKDCQPTLLVEKLYELLQCMHERL